MSPLTDYLELASPGEPVRRIPLRKARVQFGRGVDSDYRLPGAYVSRRHARVERNPEGQWQVIDLGSANGTFVNGRRVDVATLSDGDLVSIGSHRLTLRTGAEASSTSLRGPDSEIVPSDAASVVVDRSQFKANRLIPARVLTRLHQAGRRLSRSPEIEALLGALTQEFRALLRPRRVAVGREDGEQCQWPIVTDGSGREADGSDLPELLVPRVHALEGSIAVKLDALADHDATSVSQAAANSVLFPVKAGDRRLGHIYVEFDPARAQPHEETIEYLSLLTRQAALVWENLELQDARRAADELNRELNAARRIQLQLFPTKRALDPRVEIAADNVPASHVSGDYYDFQLLEPGRVLFILADVMGHGLSAALLMAGVQGIFRTGVQAGWDLPTLDRHIDDVVEASGRGETFATGVVGLCDVTDGSLTLISAGHPWPSLRCGSGSPEVVETARSYPWGTFEDRHVEPARLALDPADWSFVAFTDGLTEAPLPDGDQYGAERLVEIHHQHHRRRADDLCDQILSDVLRVSDASVPQQDDLTVLVLRGLAPA
ncbi:MAG: SpoIIE family protein phosphatase [Planctomycetota bacterium]